MGTYKVIILSKLNATIHVTYNVEKHITPFTKKKKAINIECLPTAKNFKS